jgi:ribose transport system substrate-binding protein
MSTRRSTLLSAGAVALAVLLLTACSPGTTDAADDPGGATAGGDSPVADVVADVETATQVRDSFEIPGDPVDVSALSGRTVYYVPLTAQISVFQLYGQKLGEALDSVGVDLQICDGGANPSQIAGCIDQAVGASAAAIVADNVPYGMAANAFEAARAQGIPVLIANQIPDPQHPADESLAYVPGPATEMITSAADWIIADSGGQATVVVQKVTDNPSTIAWAEAAEAEFADRCPDCTVVVNEVSAANFPVIPSSTSSAILQNPDTGYVLAEFEHFVQPTVGGIQQTPNAASITIVSSAATLTGLQMIDDGGPLHADAGQNFSFQGWATADAVFRLVAGQEVPEYDISFRLFTQDNIGDLDLSEAGEASGDWYGPTDYTDDFVALWSQG